MRQPSAHAELTFDYLYVGRFPVAGRCRKGERCALLSDRPSQFEAGILVQFEDGTTAEVPRLSIRRKPQA